MRLPRTIDQAVRFGLFMLKFEGIALLVAFGLAVGYAGVVGSRLLDAFFLMTFLLFLMLLAYAVLSGPGMFLSRPRFPPGRPEEMGLWRRMFTAPQPMKDREFFELVLYTGLAFLLLAIATGIGAVVQALNR